MSTATHTDRHKPTIEGWADSVVQPCPSTFVNHATAHGGSADDGENDLMTLNDVSATLTNGIVPSALSTPSYYRTLAPVAHTS